MEAAGTIILPRMCKGDPDGIAEWSERFGLTPVFDSDALHSHVMAFVGALVLMAEYVDGICEDLKLSCGQGGVDSNVTNKTEIIMGDKYENVQGSTVVSRSEVKGSFNRTRDGHSTKGATGGVWKWLRTVAWAGVKKRFGW